MGQVSTNLYVEVVQSALPLHLRYYGTTNEELIYQFVGEGTEEPLLVGAILSANGYFRAGMGLIPGSHGLENVEVNLQMTHTPPHAPWEPPLRGITTVDNFTVSLRAYDWQLRSFEMRGFGVFDITATIDPNHRVLETTDFDNRAAFRFRVLPRAV